METDNINPIPSNSRLLPDNVTMKNPLEPDLPLTYSLYDSNTIYVIDIIFKNNYYTTPITIELSTNSKVTTINVVVKNYIISQPSNSLILPLLS